MRLDEPGDCQESPAAPFSLGLAEPQFRDVVIEVHEPTSRLFEDQVVLAGEVAVRGAARHAGGVGDVVHRRLREPSLGEQRDSRVGDCGSCLLVSTFDEVWHDV